MVPTKRCKLWTAFDVVFLLYAPIFLIAHAIMSDWDTYTVILGAVIAWLWTRDVSARSSTRREIAAGDPAPWQFMRWMDIYGPSGHENSGHEDLYLRRLYVLRTPWFGVMLHWIKREDWDRDALHSHPWEFRRFILSGGYTEEIAYPISDTALEPTTELTHGLFTGSKFPSGAYHRIKSVKPHTVSLVINGPKMRSWGFFVPGTGHVNWKLYVNGAR